MKPFKLALAATGSAVLLGLLVMPAFAGRLSSSTQSISASWTRMDFAGGFGTVECEVTLAGTVHTRTIAKTASTLIGYLTEARVVACRRGGATVLGASLPWHITYRSFEGTLPNITGIGLNVIGASFQMREPTFGATCLMRSTAANPLIKILKRLLGALINTINFAGSIQCSGSINVNGSVSGSASSLSPVSVTLI
ncbi:MAG: hypothetical protein M3Y43_11900 [Pseudomonadota bacterium]|nr:hypothetical protein [Pseudomonadota bacterium]